jgi:cytosine/adenosine deaminase-related metal-dependent hydrolase
VPQYRAAWLLPISQPPIRDGWLRTEHGRVFAFGHCRPGDFTATDEIDLGHTVILPGLVNAHTHLELSWLRGRIPPTNDFPRWIEAVLALSRGADQDQEQVARGIVDGIAEAKTFGTAAVGDVSNSFATKMPLVEHDMPGVVFHELIGFRSEVAAAVISGAAERLEHAPNIPNVRHGIAPHAPYSVSPALFHAIRQTVAKTPAARTTVHLGESLAEIKFLQDGTGPWRTLLDTLGVWDPSWDAPKCSPVDYLERMGFLAEDVLVVHGVHLTSAELERLAATGATLVTCPRGNTRTGAGTPPIAEFFESGVRVAVGTDSLASVPDLNIFAELAEMRRLAPEIPARLLLESATVNGARALGFESDFGAIEPGKSNRLVAISLDGPVTNIEEHLVSGIHGEQIRWLAS